MGDGDRQIMALLGIYRQNPVWASGGLLGSDGSGSGGSGSTSGGWCC